MEAFLILRRDNEEFVENHFEPQHGPNDVGEALPSLCLKFAFLLRRSKWYSLVRCGDVGKDEGNSGMKYLLINRILLPFPPLKIPIRCFF